MKLWMVILLMILLVPIWGWLISIGWNGSIAIATGASEINYVNGVLLLFLSFCLFSPLLISISVKVRKR